MKKRFVIVAMMIGSLCIFSSGAVLFAGNPFTKNINVTFKDLKVMLQNKDILHDANEEAFIYQNKVYVPLRTISEAYGGTVSWDGATNTIFLGAENTAQDNSTDTQKKFDNREVIFLVEPSQTISVNLLTTKDGKEHEVAFSFDVQVEKDGDYTSRLISEVKENAPAITDAVIRTLRHTTYEDLMKLDAMDTVKKNAIQEINKSLKNEQIKDIDFLTFFVK